MVNPLCWFNDGCEMRFGMIMMLLVLFRLEGLFFGFSFGHPGSMQSRENDEIMTPLSNGTD